MNDAPRRKTRFLVLGLLALGLVALVVLRMAVFQPMADRAREEADKDAILKVLSDQDAAWNRGDLKEFMKGYWNSPDLTFYSGSDPRKGWDETLLRYQKKYQGADEGRMTSSEFTALMMERYRQQFPGPDTEMGQLTFSDLDIELLGPDSALVRGRWHLTWSKRPVGGLFTLIMKRTPEGWRIIHDHTS